MSAEQRDRIAEGRDEAGDVRDGAGHARDGVSAQRDQSGVRRDEDGAERDRAGEERDHAGVARDLAAERRDRLAEQFESRAGAGIAADDLNRLASARRAASADRSEASQDRWAGASDRGQAESDRGGALADRGAGADERSQAAHDRDTAHADRGASARDREFSARDDLTGAYRRATGFLMLRHEMVRAQRTEQQLVLAFVDVDHLKRVNDADGHSAGDRLLLKVANAMREQLRSYDLLIRFGGDEFLCVITGVDLAAASKRLALINVALAEPPEPASITFGLAELRPADSVEEVIARADAALYEKRSLRSR